MVSAKMDLTYTSFKNPGNKWIEYQLQVGVLTRYFIFFGKEFESEFGNWKRFALYPELSINLGPWTSGYSPFFNPLSKPVC